MTMDTKERNAVIALLTMLCRNPQTQQVCLRSLEMARVMALFKLGEFKEYDYLRSKDGPDLTLEQEQPLRAALNASIARHMQVMDDREKAITTQKKELSKLLKSVAELALDGSREASLLKQANQALKEVLK